MGESVSSVENKWLKMSCIFAPYTHKSGKDSNPSMGIKITPKGSSHFNCFACGEKGDLIGLIETLNKFAGDDAYDYPALLELVSQEEEEGLQLEGFDEDEEVKDNVPFSEEWLDQFLPIYNHPYIMERGISPKVAKELDIRFCHKYGRIGFPVRDFAGNLCGFQARDITGTFQVKYVHFRPKDHPYNMNVWMGEHLIDLDKDIVLVEGPFDYAKIFSVYPNVLCSMGANITTQKLKRLNYGNGKIVTFYDNDKAGDMARRHLQDFYKDRILCHIFPPDDSDPGSMEAPEIKELLMKHGVNKTLSI